MWVHIKKDKILDNSTDQSELHKIYASMAYMSSNAEIPRRICEDSSQLTNWILDSGVTCPMTPEILDFIPGSKVKTDKYIEVTDGNFVILKQTVEVQIKVCADNGKSLIATLYHVLLVPDF